MNNKTLETITIMPVLFFMLSIPRELKIKKQHNTSKEGKKPINDINNDE